jgi:hypothetical protein
MTFLRAAAAILAVSLLFVLMALLLVAFSSPLVIAHNAGNVVLDGASLGECGDMYLLPDIAPGAQYEVEVRAPIRWLCAGGPDLGIHYLDVHLDTNGARDIHICFSGASVWVAPRPYNPRVDPCALLGGLDA